MAVFPARNLFSKVTPATKLHYTTSQHDQVRRVIYTLMAVWWQRLSHGHYKGTVE
jgi:hypothetical protein